jgi:hypothetical protein
VQNVKASSCEFQGPQSLQRGLQKKVPQQKKKGGLKYIVERNGEAPKMQAIHCAFAKMAVEEMHKHRNVSCRHFVLEWNAKYAPKWSKKTSRPKGHGGKAGSGQATNFFSNQLFSLEDLQAIAGGYSPYPVELTDDDDDDADADEEADADGDPSPARGRREYNPAKVAAKPGSRQRDTANEYEVDDDDEDTPRVRSVKRRRPNPPPEGTQPAAEGPPKPAVEVGSRARGSSGGTGFGEAAGGGGSGHAEHLHMSIRRVSFGPLHVGRVPSKPILNGTPIGSKP